MARTHAVLAQRPAPSSRPALRRRHRSTLRQLDRRALERDGWRTTLDFRENHVRQGDGRLLDVDSFWQAEAERHGDLIVATARSEARAWARLREMARHRTTDPTDFVDAASA